MMATFVPMTRQQHLRGIAEVALRQYSFTDIALRLVGDAHNLVFRVSARPRDSKHAETFALRLHATDRHSAATIESEMIWLEALHRDTTLVVPRPVRNESGKLLTMPPVDDYSLARIYTLVHWVEGRIVGKRPSVDSLRKVGQLMASLHEHGRAFIPPPGFHRPRWDSELMTGRRGGLAECWHRLPRNARHVFSKVCELFDPAAQAVGTGTGSFGLIHGTLHGANALSQGKIVAAIDFDDCCYGYYLYDIAGMLDSIESRANYRELRHAFVTGYCDVNPLAKEHLAHLPVFLAARWVMCALSLARLPNDKTRLQTFLDVVVAKLRRFLRSPESIGALEAT
jgi:Ser/Thr protein kinase RdoA (MazF antagonist)